MGENGRSQAYLQKGMPMNPTDIFISYRRTDVEFVKTLIPELEKSGRKIWIDWDDIPPGVESFSDEIQRGIEGANALIAVLSPNYLESIYCLGELEEAIRLNKRIVPIVYQKFDPAPPPDGIGHINWVYFTPHAGQENTFEQAFPKVEQALDADYASSREHTRILLRALDWDKHERNKSYLLKGTEIDKAENWQVKAINKDPSPTELQSEYILDSRTNQRHQRQRLTIAIGALLVMVVIGGIMAYIQGRISHSQALASAALQPGNENISTALALEAARGPFQHSDVTKILEQVAYPIGGIQYALQLSIEVKDTFIKYPAVSPDGQYVVTENQLFDLATGTHILSFAKAPGIVLQGLYLPDGKHLILAGDDEGYNIPEADPIFLGLYDIESGNLVRKFDTGIGVQEIQLSEDSKVLIGYQPDGLVVWWDVDTGNKLREFEVEGNSSFSPNLQWLATVQKLPEETKAALVLINIETMQPMMSIKELQWGNEDFYWDPSILLQFSPASGEIAVSNGGVFDTYFLPSDYRPDGWHFETYTSCSGSVTSIRYSPSGSMIVAGCTDNTVTLYDILGEVVAKQTHHNIVNFADFVANGERVVSIDSSQYVLEWNAIPGNVAKRFTEGEGFAGFTQGGQYLFIQEGLEIATYHMGTFAEVSRKTLPANANEFYNTFFLAHGIEAGKIVYSDEEQVIIWALGSDTALYTWQVDGLEKIYAEFAPDGKTIFIQYDFVEDDPRFEIRDTHSGNVHHEFVSDPSSGMMSYAISPDGTRLLLATGTDTQLIDVASGAILFTFHDKHFSNVTFTPDGSQFIVVPSVSGADSSITSNITKIQVWDVNSGDHVDTISLPIPSPSTLTFHPDGQSFFAGRGAGGGGRGYPPLPSGISPRQVSFFTNATFNQWDYVTGDLIREFPMQVGSINLAPNGAYFVTNSGRRGGDFRVWRLDTQDKLIEWTCQNLNVPEFTKEQKDQYGINGSIGLCDSR